MSFSRATEAILFADKLGLSMISRHPFHRQRRDRNYQRAGCVAVLFLAWLYKAFCPLGLDASAYRSRGCCLRVTCHHWVGVLCRKAGSLSPVARTKLETGRPDPRGVHRWRAISGFPTIPNIASLNRRQSRPFSLGQKLVRSHLARHRPMECTRLYACCCEWLT
jgi:hypothetical protein